MFTQIITLILGVSLANERLIEYLKTYSNWLDHGQPEKTRKIVVQLLTFIVGWLGASSLVQEGFDLFGFVSFNEGENVVKFPAAMIGLLSTSGSAFWNHILSYSKAMKDIKKDQVKLEANQKIEKEKEMLKQTNLAATLDNINTNWSAPDLKKLMTGDLKTLNA